MRVLHTSDWHLGHTLYGFDREEEQRDMLRSIVEIARAEQPDAVVISGDIYDTAQPSAAIQKMFADAVDSLLDAVTGVKVVAVSGNHDSGSRHEAFRCLMARQGVWLFGQIDRDNPDRHIVDIDGKGFVVAVPYAHQRNIPEGFFDSVMAVAGSLNTGRKPVVLVAHTTVAGSDSRGHDNATDMSVGGIDAVPLSDFGSGYDYMAFGHIHKPQYIGSSLRRARYCGAPLAVSFDETYAHSVSVVDIMEHGNEPCVRALEIAPRKPLVTLPASGAAVWTAVIDELKGFPGGIPAWIRLNVEIEGFLPPEAMAEARAACEGKMCMVCHINVRRKPVDEPSRVALSVSEFKELRPEEVARRFAEDSGMVFSEEMAEMFGEALRAAEEEREG